jgi:hypothetical protein
MMVTLPGGQRVSLQQGGYKTDGGGHLLVYASGATLQYNAATEADAQYVLRQLDAAVQQGVDVLTPLRPTATGYDALPATFDLATSEFTLGGWGFHLIPTPLQLRVEDALNGEDDNGYYMDCVVINDELMVIKPGGAGDGILGPGAVEIYFKDGAGNRTTPIDGTNTAGTTITIP